MSARLLGILRCDHVGCGASFEFDPPRPVWKPPRLTDARRVMHAQSWRYGVRLRSDSGPAPSFDFCPMHAADVHHYCEVTP